MLSGERIPCCPHCGQLMTGHRYGVRFGQLALRIIDTVQRAAAEGISGETLFDVVYQDRPGAKLSALKAYIHFINMRLSESTDVRIRCARSHGFGPRRYRIVRVRS